MARGKKNEAKHGVEAIGANGGPSLFEGIDTSPKGPSLIAITKKGTEAADLAARIEDIETMLAEHKADYNRIVSVELPTLMGSMKGFTLDDGTEIEIKQVIGGSLPAAPAKRKTALTWISKNEGADMIKMQVTLDLAPGDKAAFTRVVQFAKMNKLTWEDKIGIHASTLKSYVKERLESGKKTPLETIGVYVGQVAKIKLPSSVSRAEAKETVKAKTKTPSTKSRKTAKEKEKVSRPSRESIAA